MLRLRHNPPIRYIRFGSTCRTARYISVSNRSEFLFLVNSIKVNNSAAALRDATPPLLRQFVPAPKRGTFGYVCARSGRRRFFHCLSFSDAAALRDVAPPQFSSSNTHLFDTSCCNATANSVGSFRVSSLPARLACEAGLSSLRSRPCTVVRSVPGRERTACGYLYFTTVPCPAARRIPEGVGRLCGTAPLPLSLLSILRKINSYPALDRACSCSRFDLSFREPVDGGSLCCGTHPASSVRTPLRERAALNS